MAEARNLSLSRPTFPEKMRLVNLARSYGVTAATEEMGTSRKTVYYWLRRYEEGSTENLRVKPRGKAEPHTPHIPD